MLFCLCSWFTLHYAPEILSEWYWVGMVKFLKFVVIVDKCYTSLVICLYQYQLKLSSYSVITIEAFCVVISCVLLGNIWCLVLFLLKPTISNKRSIQVMEYLACSSAICLELVLPALISKHDLLLWWLPTGTHMNGYCCCITLYMHYIVFVGNKISINPFQFECTWKRLFHELTEENLSHIQS